jgi:hypothetical protein
MSREPAGPAPAPAPYGHSVSDLCLRWKVGMAKVLGFIRRGELVAINLATCTLARPQWRITPEAVAAFERRRTSAPPPKPQRRPRRAGKDYYKD